MFVQVEHPTHCGGTTTLCRAPPFLPVPSLRLPAPHLPVTRWAGQGRVRRRRGNEQTPRRSRPPGAAAPPAPRTSVVRVGSSFTGDLWLSAEGRRG